MRTSLAFLSASLIASLALADPVATPKSHANTLSGTVVSSDDGQKRLTVRDGHGRETHLVWTTATHMTGGSLKAGQKVTVRWVRRDGKNIATALKIVAEAESASGTFPTTPSSVSPTPKSR